MTTIWYIGRKVHMTDARHIKSEMGCIKYGSICHQNLKLISYNDLIFEVEVGSDRLLEHL